MILIIVALFIASFSAISFVSSSTYEAYDHTFESLNYSLPINWVVTDVDGTDQPYYDTNEVESTVIEHCKNNLRHYVNRFKVGFYYFDSETFEQLVTERYVTGVRVSLRASIPFSSDYYKASTYLIKRN